jgi:hypothetical protein
MSGGGKLLKQLSAIEALSFTAIDRGVNERKLFSHLKDDI